TPPVRCLAVVERKDAAMARYRICTDQEPIHQPRTHAHIVAVGIGNNPNKAERRLTLQEVLTAMRNGHTFYTQGERSGRVAEVIAVDCHVCTTRRPIIRSSPDAVEDNNLDNLRRCRWQSRK